MRLLTRFVNNQNLAKRPKHFIVGLLKFAITPPISVLETHIFLL